MKYAFVTGSTRGIGLSIAKKILLDPEYNLIVHGKRNLGKEDLENIFGKENIDRVSYLQLDLSDLKKVSEIEICHSELDLFVNNAGIYDSNSIPDLINVNLTSSILLTQKVYQIIGKNRGTIINVNSLAGIYPNFKEAAYCASKFGLDGYFKSLQSECHKDGVTLSQYYLGATQTDMTKHRSDFNLLIDPDEIADLIHVNMKCKSLIPIGQTIKRKNY